MTFGELKDALYERMGISSSAATSDQVTRVERMINEATNKVATSSEWNWLEAPEVSLTLVSGTITYSLDSSIAGVYEIEDQNKSPLEKVTRDTFEDVYRGDSTTASDPTVFSVLGIDASGDVMIVVWPEPSGGSTAKVRGPRRVTKMTSDSDVPLIPAEYHYLIEEMAGAKIREWQREGELAGLMQSTANASLANIKGTSQEGKINDST